jgi:hypothetical protein
MRNKPMNRKTTDFNSGAVAYFKVWVRIRESVIRIIFRNDNTSETKEICRLFIQSKLLKNGYSSSRFFTCSLTR